MGNPIQGNLKELNAGTLEKKMNGKDLYYDLPEAISIGTKLRFNVVELLYVYF